LEIVLALLVIVCHVLVIFVAFSIASLVFFALCLRLAGDEEPPSLDNSHTNSSQHQQPPPHYHQFWMWTGTGTTTIHSIV